jgi:hypothetical protein
VHIQRYLTNIEININNKKLHDDVSPVGTHHPNSSGDGGYYFNTDDDDLPPPPREEYGNKKRQLSAISGSELPSGSLRDSSDGRNKRQKVGISDDLLIDHTLPPPPSDESSILAIDTHSVHDDSTENFDSLMLGSAAGSNAFRLNLNNDDFDTNQFLYDE